MRLLKALDELQNEALQDIVTLAEALADRKPNLAKTSASARLDEPHSWRYVRVPTDGCLQP
jgi:hypothetical protein